MFGSNDNRGGPRQPGTLERGLAATMGVAAAYVLSPLIFAQTRQWVADFTAAHYSRALSDVATWLYFAVLACALFFGGRLAVFDALRRMRHWFQGY